MFLDEIYRPNRNNTQLTANEMRDWRINRWGTDTPTEETQGKSLPMTGYEPGMFEGMSNAWQGLNAALAETGSSALTGLAQIPYFSEHEREGYRRAAKRFRSYSKEHFEPKADEMGEASQIVHGLFKMLPKAAGYTATLGSGAGALAFAADVGTQEGLRLMDEGVDDRTAISAGMTTFAANAIGLRLPAALGKSRLASATYGTFANIGTDAAERQGIQFILENQDYDALAQQYDLTWTDMFVSGAFGGAFGAMTWRRPMTKIERDTTARRSELTEELKATGQFTDEEADLQAAIHARGEVLFAQQAGVEWKDVAYKVEGGAGTGDGFAMPITQGIEWHMGPTKLPADTIFEMRTIANDLKPLDQVLPSFQKAFAEGVRNEDTGFNLTASRADIKKWTSKSRRRWFLQTVGDDLMKLAQDARLIESHTDVSHHNPAVQGIHKLVNAVRIGDQTLRVLFTIRDYDTKGQERIALHSVDSVDFELVEKANPPIENKASAIGGFFDGGTVSTSEVAQHPVVPHPFKATLSQVLGGSNPYLRADGRSYFDTVDESSGQVGGVYYEAYESTGFRQIVDGAVSDPLVTVHNISAENLLRVDALGGMPVPSLGITKAKSVFTDFGEITLIGTRGMVDPQAGVPVYSTDAYTNRFPMADWSKSVDQTKAKALIEEVKAVETGDPRAWSMEAAYLDKTTKIDPNRDEFISRFSKSNRAKLLFLRESGVEVEPVMRNGMDRLDESATELRIEEALTPRHAAYAEWVNEKTKGVFGAPQIKVGRSLVPMTLENVVRAMTMKSARNAESTITFNAGKVRSASAKKFKSIEDIGAHRDLVGDPQKVSDVVVASSERIETAAEDLARFYIGSDYQAMNAAMEALAKTASGKPTEAKLRKVLEASGFEGVTDDVVIGAVSVLRALKAEITDYFEAKPQRAVKLNEFVGAVVPVGTDPEAVRVLERQGLNVRTYPKGDVGARRQAVSELSGELNRKNSDVLYQSAGNKERGSYDPDRRTIRITSHADLSTFAHEHAHWYLDMATQFAGKNGVDQGLTDDTLALLRHWGVDGVEAWVALGTEGQRKFQEQFASWVEIYLSKGESPIPELSGLFDRFGKWLVDLYRSYVGDVDGHAGTRHISERYRSETGEELPKPPMEALDFIKRMYGREAEAKKKLKPRFREVAAARFLQVARLAARKRTAPLENPVDPEVMETAAKAQRVVLDQIQEAKPADADQTLHSTAMRTRAITQEKKNFARAVQMPSEGEASTAVVLQNRDRSAKASVGQMSAIAGNPMYSRMSFDRTTGSGAPIVSYGTMPGNRFLGVTDYVMDGSERIPVTYAVVEADSVLTSNRWDGVSYSEYGDETRINAIAGNGRMAGLTEAYNRGTTAQYVEDMIADSALTGIDPEAVRELKRPALVRFMPSEKVSSAFIERSNQSNVLEMSGTERAVQDAEKLIAGKRIQEYGFDESGDPTGDTLNRFVNDIEEPSALGTLIDSDGKPTESAKTRIRAAVFYAAYRDPELTSLISFEMDKEGIKRVLNAMAAFAPHVINIRTLSNGLIDLGPSIVKAVNMVRSGVIPSQDALFDAPNPVVQQVFEILSANKNSASAIGRVLNGFTEALTPSLGGGSDLLFGQPLDLADAMAFLRQAQNAEVRRLMEEGKKKGLEMLPDVDVEAIRAAIKSGSEAAAAGRELSDAIGEKIVQKASESQDADPQVDPMEDARARAQEVLSEDGDAVRVRNLFDEHPDRAYEMEENGTRMAAEDVVEDFAKLEQESELDATGVAKATECILRNGGIE